MTTHHYLRKSLEQYPTAWILREKTTRAGTASVDAGMNTIVLRAGVCGVEDTTMIPFEVIGELHLESECVHHIGEAELYNTALIWSRLAAGTHKALQQHTLC